MKILYGITKSNWGGAQKYVFDMSLAAKDAGHDVAVMCGGDGVLVDKLKENNIRTIVIPGFARDIDMLHDAKRLWFIIQTIKREKPDVLHVNSAKMGGAGIFAGRLLRVPEIIFTAHGWTFNEPRHWLQKLLIEELSWLTILGSHKTICVSEADRQSVASKPFVKSKIFVIHNGVEKLRRTQPEHGHKDVVVGTIAELHRNKALDIAVKGFARAFKYTDATFEIVGDGEEKRSLMQLVEEFGMETQVKFLGFKQDAASELANFDIFVLASRKEGLPYTILEAGMQKLPVIATRVGGIPEIIKDGETGLLIPPEDPKALAEALKKLSADASLRTKLGSNLYKFVKENFSKERMAEETLRLYSEAGS